MKVTKQERFNRLKKEIAETAKQRRELKKEFEKLKPTISKDMKALVSQALWMAFVELERSKELYVKWFFELKEEKI